MRLVSRNCFSFLVFITLIDKIYSGDNDTSVPGRRNARVSGRIVKLYSGPRPDPIVCLGEGFQKDPVDCSIFYRCLKTSNGKYAIYRFQCGPGTVYDPETEICNHPRSTKRLECSGLGGNKLISSTEGYLENEIEEKENQELPSPLTTKLPIIANFTYTTAASITDKSESSFITISYPSSYKPVQSTLGSLASASNIPTYLTTKNPTEYLQETSYITRKPSALSGSPCESDGFMGDTEDCRKFYRCVNNQRGGFIRYEFSCSESTIWDEDTKSCNHPWAVQRRRCGRGSSDDENVSYSNQIEINKEVPNIPHQISYKPILTQSENYVNNIHTVQNQAVINFGDRINVENQTQKNYRPALYETETQMNYVSFVTQSPLPIKNTESVSQTQKNLGELIASSTTTAKSIQYTNSLNECKKDGFMGDSNDCNKFYRCVTNEKGGFNKYEFSCSQGTLWDAKLEACNHAWAVKECSQKTSIENIHSETTNIIHPVNDYYTTVSSSILNNEIEDEIGYGSQSNQHESEQPKLTTHRISTLNTVGTESSTSYGTDCNASGFFGNINDCGKFYRCVENGRGGFTKYEYKCGEGTVWDPEIESCNHAWTVKHCRYNSEKETMINSTSNESTTLTTVSLIQTTTQKVINNDDDSGYGFMEREPSPHPTTSTERNVYQLNDCQTTGFMVDNNDCRKFYRCVQNGQGGYTKHEFTCGEGTVWDSEIEACNHAWAVKNCGGSNIKDNNSQTTTQAVTENSPDSDIGYVTHGNDVKYPESSPTTTPRTTTTIKDISHDQSKGNKCQIEGFMGDNRDCKRFYRCVGNGNGGYIQYEYSCGDGTVWDPKITACNHAWAVETCGGNISPTQGSTTSASSIDSESLTKVTTQSTTVFSSTFLSSTLSGINNECVVNGFMGDRHDCKKFYRCVNDGKGSFTRYEFNCGEGTVWDQKIEACNHVWAVESCRDYTSSISTDGSSITHPVTIKDEEIDNSYTTHNNQEINKITESNSWSVSTEKSSTEIHNSKQCETEGFMGDTNDCKRFYRCVSDGTGSYIRYEFTCGEGTIWDSEINACNHIKSVKIPCNSMLSPTTQETGQIYPSTVSSTSNDNIDYSSTVSTSTTKVSQSQCKQEGFIGDENDCKKFYRCVANGQGGFYRYEFSCGEGTAWDQKILACNHARIDQHCSVVDDQSNTSSSNVSPIYSTSSISSTTSSHSTEKIDISSSENECESEGFHANTNDCKKFFRCVSDGRGGFIKYDFTCGDGTVWVQEIQACDHDTDNYICNKSTKLPSHSDQDEPVKTTTPTFRPSNTDFSTPSNDYVGTSSNKPVAPIDDVCQSEGFYPNKNDCKQFYQCVNNGEGGYHKYEFSCSEGTAWDINTQSCNHISEVKKCHELNEGEIQPTAQTKPTAQDDSVSESPSTTETTSSTTKSTNNKDNCEESGFFGNTNDCKKFYRCVDNGKGGFTKYDFTCGDGTIWDQDIIACNHPQDVSNPSCKIENNTTSTTTSVDNESSKATTKVTPSTVSSTESTTSENSNQSTVESATNKPNNNNYTCTKAGFYADPYDCKKFYRCVDWGGDEKKFSIYHFDCGEGTIWDPELETCNHENSVYPSRDCSGTQSQNENKNETTTTTQQITTSTAPQSTTEQITTQQSTSEKSTTQQSTSEQSTTQQATTEQSTTEQSTSEQSTTQQATSEQSTTQQSTTEQSTTQQSTSEQSTTQQSTTEQSTTQQSTSEQSTTQQSTTEQSTTQQSTSEQSTTQQSTTEQSTTQQSTSEQSTTQQSTSEQSTTQKSTTEQTTTQQSTTESTTTTASTTTSEDTTTTVQITTSESTTESEQTTKAEQTTTQEPTTEDTSESQSSTMEQSTTQETTESSSTTENGQDTTTEKTSEKECPETDDDQYLFVCPTGFKRHPKYCNLFYQCTEEEDSHEMKVAVFNCPNNTIYDESKIQCVEEDKADKKCDGQIAEKRRVKRLDANYKEPITVNREKYSCPTVGHFPFEKNEECSPVLFKCEVTKKGKLRGLVYQCPQGYVYWSISRRCEPINTMLDCKRSFSNWIGRYEIPTERKNVAKK